MALEETNTVDYIEMSLMDNKVLIVTIFDDYYDYKNVDRSEEEHLYLLENKINSCCAYIISKQYKEKYPNKTFEKFIVQIKFTYKISNGCYNLLIEAKKALKKYNIDIIARYFKYRRKYFFEK